jgi:hypothetical protein
MDRVRYAGGVESNLCKAVVNDGGVVDRGVERKLCEWRTEVGEGPSSHYGTSKVALYMETFNNPFTTSNPPESHPHT